MTIVIYKGRFGDYQSALTCSTEKINNIELQTYEIEEQNKIIHLIKIIYTLSTDEEINEIHFNKDIAELRYASMLEAIEPQEYCYKSLGYY